MKKVLHILPMNKISGAEKLALTICKNLEEYKPVVVCGGDDLKKIFIKNGVQSYSIEFFEKNILNIASSLKKIIKENDIEIVHAHDNNASLYAYITKKIYRLDIKIISHIHNCYPWLKDGGKNKKIDSIFRPKYDFNIACGKTVYDFYKNNTNYIDEKKSIALSNAIDIEDIVSKGNVNKELIKQKYNIPKDKTVFGFIGRLSEQKGIIPFIIELAKRQRDFKDSVFLLVGSGDQDKEVRNLINELRLQQMVILTGHQEDVYKFYSVIDIFFLPSLYEGLPMVILEAMAFKKPIVAMNVGSISEVINEDNGILVDKGQYKDFISYLITLKGNSKMRSRYSGNAYRFVEKNYNIKNYIKKVTSIYDELACNN